MNEQVVLPEPRMMAVNAETGEPVDLSTVEEMGVGFDPTKQTLDLTKDEKRRTTALMMAIQAYNNIIIKDAEYYMAVERSAERGNGPKIKPATMDAMVLAAIRFDNFIAGKYSQPVPPAEAEQAQEETAEEPE